MDLVAGSVELKRIARELKRLDRNGASLIAVWRRAGSRIARDNRRQFATKGAFYGTPWKPLAASTVRSKLRNGYKRQMLQQTGALFRSFTSRPMDVERYGPHEATFGSNEFTARWQHGGTFRNGKRHIPPRTIQKLSPQTRREIIDMVRDHVLRGVK